MNRFLAFVLVIAVIAPLISGCVAAPKPGAKPATPATPAQPATPATPAQPAQPPKPAEITDSGRYVGQIDANSIEIKISGVPDAQAARAFRLSEQMKEALPKMGLKRDMQIKFTYTQNANGQQVITSIQKI